MDNSMITCEAYNDNGRMYSLRLSVWRRNTAFDVLPGEALRRRREIKKSRRECIELNNRWRSVERSVGRQIAVGIKTVGNEGKDVPDDSVRGTEVPSMKELQMQYDVLIDGQQVNGLGDEDFDHRKRKCQAIVICFLSL